MPTITPSIQDRFAETLLIFRPTAGSIIIDLRYPIPEERLQVLSALGPARCFAVVTAANRMGQPQSDAENAAAHRRLEEAVSRTAAAAHPVDGVSPDMTHREAGFAVWVPEAAARSLAQQFRQLAYFWFDGERFWLVSCTGQARVPLPAGAGS